MRARLALGVALTHLAVRGQYHLPVLGGGKDVPERLLEEVVKPSRHRRVVQRHAGHDPPLRAYVKVLGYHAAVGFAQEVVHLRLGGDGPRAPLAVELEVPLHHEAHRRAVLEELRDVAARRLQHLLLREVEFPHLGVGPRAHLHARADLHAGDAQLRHAPHGGADGSHVPPVQAHGDGHAVLALLEQPKHPECALLRALDAPQEVVLPQAVEAQLEARVHAAGVQLVEQPPVHEPAVGVDGREHDLALLEHVQ